jgi:hypothetical protein
MTNVTREQANYIIAYYSKLLTPTEAKALRHYFSTLKLEDAEDDRLERMYLKTGWMSTDPEILNYLENCYEPFILKCSERIVKDDPAEVFFNLCPVCQKLARTPYAKQCRYCGNDWH